MQLQKRSISDADLAFSAGNTASQRLPDSFVSSRLQLHVAGTVTVSGGASSSALVGEQPFGLINRIKIVANGGAELVNITGKRLRDYLRMMVGVEPMNTALANLDAATHTFAMIVPIDFGILRAMGAPMQPWAGAGFKSWGEVTYLPTQSFDELVLEIDWGTIADFSDATGDRTETLAVTTVDLVEEYASTGSLTPSQLNPNAYPIQRVQTKEFTVTAADADFEMELPRKRGRSIHRILIECQSDGALVDTIVNSLSIVGDDTTEKFRATGWTQLQGANQRDYGVTVTAGRVVIDFAGDGDFGDILHTDEFAKLVINADVANPGSTDKIFLTIFSIQGPSRS
jgi:hypothetical protein